MAHLTYRHDSHELLGKTVGVIGGGTIGREVIKRVKAFGTRVIYSDVFRMPTEEEEKLGCEYVPFDELIASADVITIHAPL
ncbi:MAG: NAD(P)-dependent oxidoreductase [Anaerotruncus massiliensis (ex Togo et al. 2019)]